MKKDEYQSMRKRIVGAVLATDMAKHWDDMNRFKMKLSDPAFKNGEMSEEDKLFLM